MQPAATATVDAAANLRRSSIVAAGLGVASIVVASLLGHPLMGVFATLGLGLGALNNHALQTSVQKYAAGDAINKLGFTRKVLLRLSAITLVAIGFALIVRPDGLGIFAGLAVFQILMLIGAALPVFRSLRPTTRRDW